jgi:hypothetical protein
MPKNKPMKAAMGGSVESPVSVPVQPPADQGTLVVPKFGMAKGGTVAKQTQRMLKKGGMMQEGGTVDPVSGNDVPVGAMQEEVRDDIPAQLSEGEFVFPADVVRYIGLERLMMMRQAAKKGLLQMEDMGQMSNADEATEEDTAEFESQIDEIIGVLGGREPGEKKEEDDEDDVEMAVGGMATEPAAMAQTQQALAQDQQPQNAALTEDQLNAINRTAEGMKAQQMEVPPEKQSKPTEGLKASDIIRNNLSQSQSPEQVNAYLKKIARLEKTQRLLNIRHNDTIVIGFVKSPGVIDPTVFSVNDPEKFDEAITATLATLKQAGVKRLESSSPDKMALEYLTAKGLPIEQGSPQGKFTWALNL